MERIINQIAAFLGKKYPNCKAKIWGNGRVSFYNGTDNLFSTLKYRAKPLKSDFFTFCFCNELNPLEAEVDWPQITQREQSNESAKNVLAELLNE